MDIIPYYPFFGMPTNAVMYAAWHRGLMSLPALNVKLVYFVSRGKG